MSVDLNLAGGPYTPPTSPHVDLNLGTDPVATPDRVASLRVRFGTTQVVHADIHNLGIQNREVEIRPITIPRGVVRMSLYYDNRVYRPDIVVGRGSDWELAGKGARPEVDGAWRGTQVTRPSHGDSWGEAESGDSTVTSTYSKMDPSHQRLQRDKWANAIGVRGVSGARFSVLSPAKFSRVTPWRVAAHRAPIVTRSLFRGNLNHGRVGSFIPWGPSEYLSSGLSSNWGYGEHLEVLREIPWREAQKLPSGRPRPSPLPDQYLFSTELNLLCPVVFSDITRPNGRVLRGVVVDPLLVELNLSIFPCGKQEGRPAVIIPVLRVYYVSNSMVMFRVSDGTEINVYSANVEIDRSTWAWGLNATIPYQDLYKVEPTSSGPVEVEVQLNSLRWRFLVESYDSSEAFLDSACTIRGRSVSSLLDDPYSTKGDHVFSSSISAQQIALYEIGRSVDTSFDLDWSLVPDDSTEWILPGNAVSYQGLTPVQSIAQMVDGVKGILNSHPYMRRLIVKSRYPAGSYWNWGSAAPDLEIPLSVVLRRGLTWEEAPNYNGVYVSGDQFGVNALIKRGGTAGDFQMDTHVSPFISGAGPAREAGMSLLNGAGRKAKITLELPLIDTMGYVMPGDLIQMNNEGLSSNWRGVVQGAAVSGAMDSSSGALSISQSISVERHY